jgi:ATP-dependent helicase/nuclease subunit B
MQRRLRAELADQGAGLMPRIALVGDPLVFAGATALPPAVPPLRRRLELAQLVDRLLQADPTLAPRSALYDLADSLARLFSEMQAEGVPIERIAGLDVSSHSAHWQRALRFVTLVEQVLRPDAMDPEGRLRAQTEALIDRWADQPPPDPVLIAGSTGSRGTTALLMQAVARLPQGQSSCPDSIRHAATRLGHAGRPAVIGGSPAIPLPAVDAGIGPDAGPNPPVGGRPRAGPCAQPAGVARAAPCTCH